MPVQVLDIWVKIALDPTKVEDEAAMKITIMECARMSCRFCVKKMCRNLMLLEEAR